MNLHPEVETEAPRESVPTEELNSWRRGFTPQAEIWNGRMAMFGLAIGLIIVYILKISL